MRKATDRYELSAETSGSLDDFLDLNDKVFERQGLSVPYSRREVQTLLGAVEANARATVITVRDAHDQPHAGCLVVSDEHCGYYLLGGADPELRASGAGYLAIWSAMKELVGSTNIFDFEGSMLKPIERVFRLFGTTQVPYHSISKTQSKTLRLALAARSRGR